jgi:DMSO reductase family type II enzyme chaperone
MEETEVRASLYCYFAMVFHYPDEEGWCFINDSAGEVQECLADVHMSTGAFDEFLTALTRTTRDEIEPIYVRTFLNGVPSVIAPPYESFYGADEERLAVMAAVTDFYERCGVELSDDFRDMPDYIATELEFMHYLCIQQHTLPAYQSIIAKAAREFLTDHLIPFVQAMTAALPDGLYHHALRALQSFVVEDLARMENEPVDTDTSG